MSESRLSRRERGLPPQEDGEPDNLSDAEIRALIASPCDDIPQTWRADPNITFFFGIGLGLIPTVAVVLTILFFLPAR